MIPANVATMRRVMARVIASGYSFDMVYWYTGKLPKNFQEHDLRKCGTVACALGWFAASAEGQRAGWSIQNEIPVHKEPGSCLFGAAALAYYLDLPDAVARGLCGDELGKEYVFFYGTKHPHDVTAVDVVNALNMIEEGKRPNVET